MHFKKTHLSKKKSQEKFEKELNENENTTYENLWDAVKLVLRGKIIAWNEYIRKQGKLQISNLSFHLRKLEKEEKLYSKLAE